MKKKEYKKMFYLEDKHFYFIGKKFFIKNILDKHLKNKKKLKILDIGCGTGGQTLILKKYGNIVGLEKNKLAINFSKKRKIKVIKANAQTFNLKNKNFDLITIFDVLYHKNIINIEKVIENIKKHLKNGGALFIIDSAFNFLRSNHDDFVYGNKRFTIQELKKILEKRGFKIIKSSYIYFSIFPFILIKRLIINKIIKQKNSDVYLIPKILNFILIKILFLESVLLKHISFPIGSSLIIFAEKLKK